MKKTKAILIGLIAIFAISSCDIERLPHSSMDSEQITSNPTETLGSTMVGMYSLLNEWINNVHRAGEYGSDNAVQRNATTDAFSQFLSYQARSTDNYRLEALWNNSYKIVSQASNILNSVQPGTDVVVNQSLGEAHYLRALMYFNLCRLFGRPYYDNPSTNLGVPIVNGTPEDIDNIVLPDRSTVAEVYAQVISDLEKAAELMTVDKGPTYASDGAAYALLSRVYLYMSGTWDNPNKEYADKAAEYAQKTIDESGATLLPRSEFMLYNTYAPENNKETIFAIKQNSSDDYPAKSEWQCIGSTYIKINNIGFGPVHTSYKYIQLLDETGRNDYYNGNIVDARANFIKPQYDPAGKLSFRFVAKVYNTAGVHTEYQYRQGEVKGTAPALTVTINETVYPLTAVDATQGIYSIEYKDANASQTETYTGVVDQAMLADRGLLIFYSTKCAQEGEESLRHSPVIARLGEIYLNLAEAEAKSGDLGAALIALNKVRERSLPTAGYASLTTANYSERIDKERHLELFQQGERSFDVFRNAQEMERGYPGLQGSMDVIQPNDARSIYFIPQDIINAYMPNDLTQNPLN